MENGSMNVIIYVQIAIIILLVVSMWKIFSKAGRPGWTSLIPIYNLYVLLKIAGKPGWWLLLLLVPLINIVFVIIMVAGIAQNFDKGGGFAAGLIFLPFIFYPLLAFGEAEYVG